MIRFNDPFGYSRKVLLDIPLREGFFGLGAQAVGGGIASGLKKVGRFAGGIAGGLGKGNMAGGMMQRGAGAISRGLNRGAGFAARNAQAVGTGAAVGGLGLAGAAGMGIGRRRAQQKPPGMMQRAKGFFGV